MTKIFLAFAALILIVALAAGIFAFQKATTPTATIKGHDFKLLIADTEEERQEGLSKYEKIEENKGMLFIFEKADSYRFWMKDMKFAVDIIFIKDNKISQIVDNAKPPKDNQELTIYPSTEQVDKVLEINGGLSRKYNFQKGDEVKFSNLE